MAVMGMEGQPLIQVASLMKCGSKFIQDQIVNPLMQVIQMTKVSLMAIVIHPLQILLGQLNINYQALLMLIFILKNIQILTIIQTKNYQNLRSGFKG